MDTKKKSIRKSKIRKDDNGVPIVDLLKILNSTDDTSKIIKSSFENYFNLTDFIPIKGAHALLDSQIMLNNISLKKDLVSRLEDITIYSKNPFTINFHNISDSINFPCCDEIQAHPIYSAQRDFFSNLFNMDRYAKKLVEKGLNKILESNLELLKKENLKKKKYRLLYYKPENRFYLRAVVSVDNYFDYNISTAVVLALLTLFNDINKSGVAYSLSLCEYNESNIRMFFDTGGQRELEGIGYVKNIIEISNDEIKREALRFSGVCTISFTSENEEAELFLRPKDVKSKILTIKHNQKPQNALKSLADFGNAEIIHNELYEDIKSIKNIKNTEQIKFLVLRKIENAKNEDIKKFKYKLSNELITTTTKNIIDLLKAFKKIQLIANEDIEASEYLRFVIYEALIKKK